MPTLTDSIPAPFEVNNYSEERYISGEDTVFAELDSKLSRPHAKSSAYRASYNIICTVVGTGLVSISAPLHHVMLSRPTRLTARSCPGPWRPTLRSCNCRMHCRRVDGSECRCW